MQAHCSPRQVIGRHRHATAYAAVILAGGYEEAGSEGRRSVGAGDVLVHHEFESHLDRIGTKGAEVLNITLLPGMVPPQICAGRIPDPERLARVHRADPVAARALLVECLIPGIAAAADWPDLLRGQLFAAATVSLSHWARDAGLARETVSRGFAKTYGLSPAAFRLEARTRRAWRRIVREATPFAAIAVEEGFCDQPHMTRAIVALTGLPPGSWRPSTSHRFKTAGHACA